MRSKIIGSVAPILAIAALISCDKNEYVPLEGSTLDISGKYASKELRCPDANELVTFGELQTKASLVPIWTEGDMLCIFSLDADDKIMYKDTCTVYSINRDVAKITAEVAKEASRYFASYPYDHIAGNVGEVLDLSQDGYVNHTGIFGDESVMVSFCPKSGRVFAFESRYSLMKVSGLSASSFPVTFKFYLPDGSKIERTYTSVSDTYLYVAVSNDVIEPYRIDVTYKSKRRTVTKSYTPKVKMSPACVYPFSI